MNIWLAKEFFLSSSSPLFNSTWDRNRLLNFFFFSSFQWIFSIVYCVYVAIIYVHSNISYYIPNPGQVNIVVLYFSCERAWFKWLMSAKSEHFWWDVNVKFTYVVNLAHDEAVFESTHSKSGKKNSIMQSTEGKKNVICQ